MNIEQMSSRKANLEWGTFLLMLIWIFSRIMYHLEIEGFGFVRYLTQLTVTIMAVFLVIQYWALTQLHSDEFEVHIKHLAYRFSWMVTLLTAMILYILSDKQLISSGLAIELIVWTGYISFLLVRKFLEWELNRYLSARMQKTLVILGILSAAVILGFTFGYSTPVFKGNELEELSGWYYASSGVIVVMSVLGLIQFRNQFIKEKDKS